MGKDLDTGGASRRQTIETEETLKQKAHSGRPAAGDAPKVRQLSIRITQDLYDRLKIIVQMEQLTDPTWNITGQVTTFLEDLAEQHKDDLTKYDDIQRQA